MINTLAGNSRLWLAGFVLLGLGSLVGCISDDSDPAAEETGGTGGGTSGSGGTGGGSTGGSSTGGSSTGGSGGTAPTGTACSAPIAIPPSAPGIADFETYEGQVLKDWSFPLGGETSTGVFSGPFGYGDDGVDATGQPTPETFAMVDGYDSTYALSISDMLAEEYGGGMGLWMSTCLDATAFTGISFWVRGNAPTGEAKLTLLMEETTSSMPASASGKKGTCPGIDTGDAATCVHPSTMFPVTDAWTEVRVAFAAMTAGRAVSTPVVPDGRNIWQIQFDVGLVWVDDGSGVYEPTPAEYEFVVDDLAFYRD